MTAPSRCTPLIVLLASLGSLVTPVAASGELPPSQAVADRGAWLPFAPAPAQPGGICMIDSGVEINPDTQPEVIARKALDGGDPGDVSPIKHGTLMAMEAAAPPNGWGMIGAAPTAVRIVSMRAESTTDALTIGAYKQAILTCQDLAQQHPEYNLKVISMSIGFQDAPPPEQLAELEDAATAAHNAGLDLLAAAGDESSQAISYPAAVPPIIAVGASGASRAQCSFSNNGTAVALLAPGCDLEEANPASGAPLDEYAGTSQATAITAAVLAAVRAYQPQLGPIQAEQLLTSTARSAGGSLDVTSLFQSAGLNSVVEAGQRNEPPPATAVPPPPISARTVPAPRLPRPRVSIHRRRNTLLVRFLNLPAEGKAILSVLGPRRHHHRVELARMATRHRTVRLQARANALLSISYAPLQANRARTSPPKMIGL
jgi:Subtilase family